MTALKVKVQDEVRGLVSSLLHARTGLVIFKAVLKLLVDAGMEASEFIANDLFDMIAEA